MKYDYIIVGCGPAGTVSAYCLQKQGYKCLILEAKNKLTEKTCGGFVTWSGLSRLADIGMQPKELISIGAQELHRITMIKNNKEKIVSYYGEEYGIGTQRLLLDKWLLEQALRLGADVKFNSRVKSYYKHNNSFRVNGEIAKRLVFATGAYGYRPVSSEELIASQSFGISAQIFGESSLADDTVYFWYLDENTVNYFWVVPIGQKMWNIGIWFQSMPADSFRKFRYYKNKLIDVFFYDHRYIRSPHGSFCGHMDFSVYLENNCFGVGDFAGCNIKTTGEGIRYAIESAISRTSRGV